MYLLWVHTNVFLGHKFTTIAMRMEENKHAEL